RQFTDAGKVVFPVSSTAMEAPANLALISDEPMFMVYDATYKIYATRLDASGNFVWPGDKIEISSTTASGSTPKGRYGFTPDGTNRCAGIWTETRGSAELGYAQGISIGGLIGLSVATQGGVPAVITNAGGTLQMVATVFPSSANQNVTWSIVPGTGAASISPTGLVTAGIDGTVYAKAVAVQDNTMKDSLMITISGQVPLAPSVTTLAATNISGTGATLNGSVIAHNASTSVTFNWGTSISYGNTIAASPSTVTGNTTTQVLAGLSGLSEGTTYHFRCVGTNSVGTTYGSDLSFTTCLTPVTPGAITGTAVVCQNQSGVTYSISPVLNATSYSWSVPAGALITAGNGTTSITVSFSSNATSGNVTVYGVNSCTSGTPASKAISVNTAPNPTIAGSDNVCLSSLNYAYSTEAGMNNYTWAVSSGGSILAGAGTNSIQVHWNNAGAQNLSVNYNNSNGCQAQNPTLLNVTVNNKPDASGVITGHATLCAGAQGITYSIDPVSGATTYEWLLPSGASMISGSGTNSITVNYSYNAVSGSIGVIPQNSCGNGTGSNLAIVVSAAPPTPAIIANGYLLTSTTPSGNQWFHDGIAVIGATSQTYTVHATGWYWTVVNTGGCSSDSSNNIYILWVGTTEYEAGNIDISPVPNDGHFSISITSPSEISYTLDIYNNLGLLIFGSKTIRVNRTAVIPVDLSNMPGGLYTVVLKNNATRLMRKLLIDK
ncbi:MAG: Ig-like domain-containing protein, partial [Bacteroidetes bacterium]|nr:Ig-like domain-containing protein [Bacteroidota bacterium]